MRILLLVFVMLLMSSCSSNTNNWPSGMTPFFAECEGEDSGGGYTIGGDMSFYEWDFAENMPSKNARQQ